MLELSSNRDATPSLREIKDLYFDQDRMAAHPPITPGAIA
jgi:hypothetical protein